MNKLLLAIAIIASTASASHAQTTAEIAKGNCENMATVIESTMNYCTTKKGKLAEASVTNALKDCLNACKSTRDFMVRDSSLKDDAGRLCAKACQALAKSCDRFPKDAKMIQCANEARKTESNVRKLASNNAQ